MTLVRPGFAASAAMLAFSLAAAMLGTAACTQGQTPDCDDSACGAGPAAASPEGSVVSDASAGGDAG